MKISIVSGRTGRYLLWSSLALTVGLSLYHPQQDTVAVAEPAKPHVRPPLSRVLPSSLASAPLATADLTRSLQIVKEASSPVGEPLFAMRNWAPPPPPPPPPAPPKAPVLPFKFMGKLLAPGKPPQIYLSNNNQVYVVKQGDMLDGVYKLEKIGDDMLTLTYLPLKQTQTLYIGRE